MGGGEESHRVVIDSQGASSKRWPTIKIRGHIIKTTFHPIKKYYSPVADRKTGQTDCSAIPPYHATTWWIPSGWLALISVGIRAKGSPIDSNNDFMDEGERDALLLYRFMETVLRNASTVTGRLLAAL